MELARIFINNIISSIAVTDILDIAIVTFIIYKVIGFIRETRAEQLAKKRAMEEASKAMQERVLNTPNIEVLWNTNTKEILGDEFGVTGAALVNNKTGEESSINIHGFFLAIGHHPNSEVFKPYIETNAEGYIITDGKSQKTSVPGVFAAGDVQDPTYRQAIAAAGSGCRAAMDAEKFLQENQ